jgi:hypothetical protein
VAQLGTAGTSSIEEKRKEAIFALQNTSDLKLIELILAMINGYNKK